MQYVSDRFGSALAKLGVEMRREVAKELNEAGLSTRAIAPVLGVSHKTVARDIEASGVSHDTPEPLEFAAAPETNPDVRHGYPDVPGLNPSTGEVSEALPD